MLYVEIIISENPSFSASAILESILPIDLISPFKPTSPQKHILLLIAISLYDDMIAKHNAKSADGSSILIPPAIFMKTS